MLFVIKVYLLRRQGEIWGENIGEDQIFNGIPKSQKACLAAGLSHSGVEPVCIAIAGFDHNGNRCVCRGRGRGGL